MTSVSGSSLSVSFEYDGDGKRVKSTITSRSTTTTVYIGDNFEWTGSTSTMKRYYYAGQTRIAMRTGSLLNWLFGDHLGPSAALQGYNSTSRVAGMIFTVTR